jgi:hypothetical protein
MEAAKRRLLYTLVHLGLFELAATNRYAPPLRFRFLSDGPGTGEKVLTGHASGVITINLSEADPSHREAVRESLGERYRTLLGDADHHRLGHLHEPPERPGVALPGQADESGQIIHGTLHRKDTRGVDV